MCGRVTLKTTREEIEEFLGISLPEPLPPRYNIAPTQPLFVARRIGAQPAELKPMRWGLSPFTQASGAPSCIINVRSETAAQKASFKNSYKQRRCVIPVDGFYEWKGAGKKKQPFHIRPRGAKLFALAGIWEAQRGAAYISGPGAADTCAILTIEANELLAPMHNRMPLILEPKDFELWMNPEVQDPAELQPLLRSYPSEKMETVPVGTWVNSALNEGEKCLEPAKRDLSLPEKTLWDL